MNTQNYDDTEIDKMIRFIELNENVIAKTTFSLFIKLAHIIRTEVLIVNY